MGDRFLFLKRVSVTWLVSQLPSLLLTTHTRLPSFSSHPTCPYLPCILIDCSPGFLFYDQETCLPSDDNSQLCSAFLAPCGQAFGLPLLHIFHIAIQVYPLQFLGPVEQLKRRLFHIMTQTSSIPSTSGISSRRDIR